MDCSTSRHFETSWTTYLHEKPEIGSFFDPFFTNIGQKKSFKNKVYLSVIQTINHSLLACLQRLTIYDCENVAIFNIFLSKKKF